MWRELFTILIDKEKGVLSRIGPLIEPLDNRDTSPSSAGVDGLTKVGHNYDPSISEEEYLLWYSSLGERVLPVPVRQAIAKGLTAGES